MTDSLQQRQRKCRSLAGAGRRLSEQISACKERRNRFALDGGGFFVAQRFQRREKRRFKS
jgi:hypothetical protein